MAEPTKYEFSYQEVAEALIKKQGLTEGCWAVNMKFGLGAAIGGPNQTEPVPCAMVPVLAIGIHRVQTESYISVDASKVNAASKRKKK